MIPEISNGPDDWHTESKMLLDVPMEEVQSPSNHSFSLFNIDWPHLQCQFPLGNENYQPTRIPHLEALDQSMQNYEQHALLYQLSEKAQEQEIMLSHPIVVKKGSRQSNDTKNIPKNFGKGIITFIERNEKKIRQLLMKSGINHCDFWKRLKAKKKSMHTIAELRAWWTDQVTGKVMRMVSNLFFRKHSLNYIFNSRITSYAVHIKYRKILWETLQAPENFDHIKKY